MRVVLVHNPGAGDDSAPGKKELKALVRDAGHEVEYCAADGRKWKEEIERKPDLVAVAGGDGTVAKVARRMIGTRIPIAVLPLGTANNISKSLGVRHMPLEELIAGWRTPQRRRYDAGVVSGPWGERHFIEGVGAGLFAGVMTSAKDNRTLERLQDAEARATYAQQIVRDRLKASRPLHLELTADGEAVSGDYILFEAMNMEFIGPNLYLAPDSVSDDGRLDLVLVAERERKRFDEYLATWQQGVTRPAEFKTIKASHIEFEWTGFELHVDDSVFPHRKKAPRPRKPEPVSIDVERDALEFLVPGRDDAAASSETRAPAS